MSAITKAKPAGCGCGGGGCGCDQYATGICADGALARPRFFAGQLLTQEDLQLIVDYAVGKNRLHNRFLFGEGVVCGLSVTCPPCGGASVVVAPGYALDCCGNDIYVPCPTEVDVNALVRDLRARQLGGWDCGDPCARKTCDDDRQDLDAKRGEEREPAPLTYHYCLYIRYQESQVAPVAPYASDAPCGAVACEPSRICEGYAFELRCEGERAAPADILDRIKACIGDLVEAAAQAQRAQVHSARAVELKRASAVLLADRPVALEEADIAAMQAAVDRLNAANLAAEGARPDEATLRRHLADFELLSVGLARAGAPEGREPGEVAQAARQALEATSEPLARLAPDLLADPVARAAAVDLVALARRNLLTAEGAAPNPAELRMLRAGAAISTGQIERMQLDLARLKAFIQERLLRSQTTTSCDLLDRLRRVRIGEDAALDPATVRGTAEAAEALALILLEMFRDCICLALNPPCTPCEDPALLLACLTIRDCEVIDICNMGRRFVLSPAALRYWLPPVTQLGRLFEKFCCEFEFRRARREPEIERQPLDPERSFYRTSAAPRFSAAMLDPDTRIVVERAGLSLGDVEQLSVLGGQLGTLSLAHAPALATLADLGERELGRRVRALPVEGLRQELREEIDRRAETSRAETLAAAREEFAAAIEKSAALRELATENRRLRDDLKRVSDAVKKLQR